MSSTVVCSLLLCLLWMTPLCTGEILETPSSVGDVVNDGLLGIVNYFSQSGRRVKRDSGGFARLSWQHCGTPHDPVIIRKLHLTPNPVHIPGRIEAGVQVDVRMNQSSPIQADIKMLKKIPLLFGYSTWMRVPCYSNGLGSCTFPDICNTRLLRSGRPCPSSLQEQNIPCACPFKEGIYELPPLVYDVPPPPRSVPKYFLEGEFNVQFLLHRAQYPLACYETNLVVDL